ncbi:ribonuclease PH [Vermiphilus pyriformis]|nr:MAG: ribonuclease PH [Vermiphilus pyriformis]
MNTIRLDGRAARQLRPFTITRSPFGYAEGCVMVTMGNTVVLCTVTMSPGVPHFLKGKKTGWLTAEYAMLPNATQNRTTREFSGMQRNSRSVEISRIIGRSLRAIVDLSIIGERTITVDCDVLQADGGTRTACINGAYLALTDAIQYWIERRYIDRTIITDTLAAISIGVRNNIVFTDLSCEEDNSIDADYTIVLTRSEHIIELQGTSEKSVVSWDLFDTIKQASIEATREIFAHFDKYQAQHHIAYGTPKTAAPDKVPLFSLYNRSKTQNI